MFTQAKVRSTTTTAMSQSKEQRSYLISSLVKCLNFRDEQNEIRRMSVIYLVCFVEVKDQRMTVKQKIEITQDDTNYAHSFSCSSVGSLVG